MDLPLYDGNAENDLFDQMDDEDDGLVWDPIRHKYIYVDNADEVLAKTWEVQDRKMIEDSVDRMTGPTPGRATEEGN
jgi:hypothetical protein